MTPDPARLESRFTNQQRGIISRDQLVACEFDASSIRRMLKSRRLIRIHPSTYAVGHAALSREARIMAAFLAAGPGAMVTHHTAVELMAVPRIHDDAIHITTPRFHRPLVGVKLHESVTINSQDMRTTRGFTTSSSARTIVDLADYLTVQQLAFAINELAFRKLFNLTQTRACIERNKHRPGPGNRIAAQALAGYLAGNAGTRSPLEDRYLKVVHGPVHEVHEVNRQRRVNGTRYELDVYYPRIRLCVELDGGGHDRPSSRRRDAELARDCHADGIRLLRLRHRHVFDEQSLLVARITREMRASTKNS